MKNLSLLSAVALLGAAQFSASAADWPEWGGRPMRNMYSTEKNLPSTFGKIEFKPGTEDINANGNDGPFKDEAKYFVKDVTNPDGTPAAPVEPGSKDADIIWVYDMMDELGVYPHNASNCSILIVGDTIYVCTSNGQDWSHQNI